MGLQPDTRWAWASAPEPAGTRATSALAVAVVHALIGYALVAGLGFVRPLALDEPLKLFDIAPEPPPPPEEPPPPPPPPRAKAERPQGAPAPPALEARPTPIVAPLPRIRIDVVQQIGAAPVAG